MWRNDYPQLMKDRTMNQQEARLERVRENLRFWAESVQVQAGVMVRLLESGEIPTGFRALEQAIEGYQLALEYANAANNLSEAA